MVYEPFGQDEIPLAQQMRNDAQLLRMRAEHENDPELAILADKVEADIRLFTQPADRKFQEDQLKELVCRVNGSVRPAHRRNP